MTGIDLHSCYRETDVPLRGPLFEFLYIKLLHPHFWFQLDERMKFTYIQASKFLDSTMTVLFKISSTNNLEFTWTRPCCRDETAAGVIVGSFFIMKYGV